MRTMTQCWSKIYSGLKIFLILLINPYCHYFLCRNCNNLASAQCECELNLIGDEHYENFDKGCSSFSNIKANNQIEIENSTNSLKNGIYLLIYFI